MAKDHLSGKLNVILQGEVADSVLPFTNTSSECDF